MGDLGVDKIDLLKVDVEGAELVSALLEQGIISLADVGSAEACAQFEGDFCFKYHDYSKGIFI